MGWLGSGVETAAELHDLLMEGVMRYFPYLEEYVKVKVVSLADRLLEVFDSEISEYATSHFRKSGISLILEARHVSLGGQTLFISYP